MWPCAISQASHSLALQREASQQAALEQVRYEQANDARQGIALHKAREEMEKRREDERLNRKAILSANQSQSQHQSTSASSGSMDWEE